MKKAILIVFLATLIGAAAAYIGGQEVLVAMSLIGILVGIAVEYRLGVVILAMGIPFLGLHYQSTNILFGILLITAAAYAVKRRYTKRERLGANKVSIWLVLVMVICSGALLGLPHLDRAHENLAGTELWDAYNLREYLRLSLLVPISIIATSWLLGQLVLDSRRPEWIIGLFAILGMAIAAAIVIAVGTSGLSLEQIEARHEFLGVLGQHKNDFGPMLAVAMAPFLFLAADTRGARRFFYIIVLLGMGCGLALTFSRGGYLAFLVMLAIFLVRRGTFRTLAVAGLMIAAALAVAPDAVLERATSGMDSRSVALAAASSERDELTAGRFALYAMFVPEIEEHPILGNGTGSAAWSAAVRNGWTIALHPHNMYLRVLMDVGIIGLLILSVFWWKTGTVMNKLAQSEGSASVEMRAFFAGSFAGIFGMLFAGVSGGHWLPAIAQPFLWYSVGVALAVSEKPVSQATKALVRPASRERSLHVSLPRSTSKF